MDSGSTDRTVEIARPYCDQVITIPAEAFTYGRALNLGAEHASGEVVFALSAHCVPSSSQWVELSLDAYRDGDVAGTWGPPTRPDGSPLNGPAKFSLADLGSDATWGFSNHALVLAQTRCGSGSPSTSSSLRAKTRNGCGGSCRLVSACMPTPALWWHSSHRRDAGLRSLYKRVHRERLVLCGDAWLPASHRSRPGAEMVVRLPGRQAPARTGSGASARGGPSSSPAEYTGDLEWYTGAGETVPDRASSWSGHTTGPTPGWAVQRVRP